jgi:type II secretory pathway pseudopilin PulG
MAPRRRNVAGFTVIEVLVALTLMAMVILLVTRAFLVVLSVTSQGGRVTTATALAAKQMEAIRTSVEAQPSRDAWRTAFCGIAAAGRSAFAAPYGSYEYQVLLNDTAVSARSGQESDLLPCWAVEWSRTGCGTQPAYAGGCAADADLGQDDRMRWVTIEVFFRSGAEPVARLTSALMRGAYHR